MLSFPALPLWAGLHPSAIHFPIALLLVAPLFVLLAIVMPVHARKAFQWSAIILMLMGSAMAIVAVETGEAAKEQTGATGLAKRVLHEHEEMA